MPDTSNPFSSQDPTLRNCLINVFGQQRYSELATKQPKPEEQIAMEPCMGPNAGDADQGGWAAPEESNDSTAPNSELAQEIYSADITGQLLLGYLSTPPGFDDCIIGRIGGDRLGEIRFKQPPTGGENSHAADCLLLLQKSSALQLK